ncbi:hydrogenase maturation nickel metallochaperone HypA [Nitrosophilus alvini]|uniref:hydrogenase maturation nickel metallochaperone HypA n=1 Tax=Nitrosophilus alvini TaxID=2714855 RepID=UPI00190BC416|nr:hydrogenase maturation nickel metallochaperone HypA [Nitrosophilus alvini]
MHEYSIVQSLLDLVEENARKHEAKKIKKIVVKIGRLSGVEPHLLEIAFNTFKEGTICEEADFVMNIQELKVRCKKCDVVSEIESKDLLYECPSCSSCELEVLDGEDMYLMSLEME